MYIVVQRTLAKFGWIGDLKVALLERSLLQARKILPLRIYNGIRSWPRARLGSTTQCRISRRSTMAPNAGNRFNSLHLPFVEVHDDFKFKMEGHQRFLLCFCTYYCFLVWRLGACATYKLDSSPFQYIPGSVPIILSVPHGGLLEPADIPDRY